LPTDKYNIWIVDKIEFMKDRLQKTKDNTEFLITMNG